MNILNIDPVIAGELLDLHLEYGQLFLFKVISDGLICVARPLLIAESETISKTALFLDEYHIHEWVVNKTLGYCNKGKSYLFEDAKAGILPAIAEGILKASNIIDEKMFVTEVENRRKSINNLQNVLEGYITQAYKGMTPFDTKKLTQVQQLDYFVTSEAILGTPLEIGEKSRKKRAPRVPDGYQSIGGEPEVYNKKPFNFSLKEEADAITEKGAGDLPEFSNGGHN